MPVSKIISNPFKSEWEGGPELPPSTSITCDEFLGGRVSIHQPQHGFRAGLDAVLVAAACPAQPGQHVLEAGCGVGTASLCLLARIPEVVCTGIEINSDLANLASLNARFNKKCERFHVINTDLTQPWSVLRDEGVLQNAYHHVIANPPFFVRGRGRLSSNETRAQSCEMEEDGLDRWARFFASTIMSGGKLTLIHKADSLPEVLEVLQGRFGGLKVMPIYSKPRLPAIRIIVTGVKGSRAPLALLPEIKLQQENGLPSAEANAVLREGQSLASAYFGEA